MLEATGLVGKNARWAVRGVGRHPDISEVEVPGKLGGKVGRWYLDHIRYHTPQGTAGRLTHLPGWVVEVGRQDTDTEEKRRKLVEVIKGSKPLLVSVEAMEGDPKEHEEVTKKLFDMQVMGSRYGLSVEAPGRNTWRKRAVSMIQGKSANVEARTNARHIVEEFARQTKNKRGLGEDGFGRTVVRGLLYQMIEDGRIDRPWNDRIHVPRTPW